MPHENEKNNCQEVVCVNVARRGARLADEERGAAKRRGRGLGQRNFFSYFILQLVLKKKGGEENNPSVEPHKIVFWYRREGCFF